jgi:hypothetical protein
MLEARTGDTAFPGPAVESASARLARDPDIPESLGADWVSLLRAMTAREAGDRPSAVDVAMTATALGTAASARSGTTAPTIAFAEVAGAPTQLDADALDDDGATTADTRVLPAPDRSFFGVPARIDTPAAPDTAPTGGTPPSGPRRADAAFETRLRPWLRPTIAISLIVVLAGVVAALLFSTLTAPEASPTPAPLPPVPGDLGVHLQELDEAVTGG